MRPVAWRETSCLRAPFKKQLENAVDPHAVARKLPVEGAEQMDQTHPIELDLFLLLDPNP